MYFHSAYAQSTHYIIVFLLLFRQRGRVEEVVVSDVCRGKQLGKLWVLSFKNTWLIQEYCIFFQGICIKSKCFNVVFCLVFFRLVSTLTLLSKKLQCYKVTLECAPKNVEFYKKFGYSTSDDTYMQCRFFEWIQKIL